MLTDRRPEPLEIAIGSLAEIERRIIGAERRVFEEDTIGQTLIFQLGEILDGRIPLGTRSSFTQLQIANRKNAKPKKKKNLSNLHNKSMKQSTSVVGSVLT